MFDHTLPVQSEVVMALAATLADLTARIERIDSQITTPTAPPSAGPVEWVWEGNRARRAA